MDFGKELRNISIRKIADSPVTKYQIKLFAWELDVSEIHLNSLTLSTFSDRSFLKLLVKVVPSIFAIDEVYNPDLFKPMRQDVSSHSSFASTQINTSFPPSH